MVVVRNNYHGRGQRRTGRFIKGARKRELVRAGDVAIPVVYANALRVIYECEPSMRPKLMLRRLRADFCYAAEPDDWPGDHKLLKKIAFLKNAFPVKK